MNLYYFPSDAPAVEGARVSVQEGMGTLKKAAVAYAATTMAEAMMAVLYEVSVCAYL